MTICLCGCNNPAVIRGLCHATYQMAWQMVRHKEVTWLELEAAGKALPRQRHRKSPRAKFFEIEPKPS